MDKTRDTTNEITAIHDPSTRHETPPVDFYKPDALIGQRLDGRFLIEKNLTESGADAGGIGLVYLAKDVKLMDKEVVVKILREEALAHGDIIRKFMHEREALIRLNHPGIVRILDSGTLTDGNPFMVMEFIEGHSLRHELRTKGQLSFEVAANVIESLTDALAAAHAEQILHRDIKPENIMLSPVKDSHDRVRVIDFGIAKVGGSKLAPETEIGRLIGTIIYIAPEQLIGKLDLTPAVDVFATGIVAYEMVTGTLPYKPIAIAEMYQLEKEGVKIMPSKLRPDLPRAAENLILAALEFESDKRPQNIRTWGRALANELRADNRNATNQYYTAVNTEFANSMTEIGKIAGPTEFETATQIAIPPSSGSSNRKLLPIALGAIALLAVSLSVGYFALRNNTTNTVPPPVANVVVPDAGPAHEVSYWLNVQRMRDKKVFGKPLRSSGREIFETGWKFTMVFQPDADGYLYIFSQGPDDKGNIVYHLLFPLPDVNNGSAQLPSGEKIVIGPYTVDPGEGKEIMQMIWMSKKDADIDSVAAAATKSGGELKDIAKAALLLSFLEKNKPVDPETDKDPDNPRTIIRGKGETLVSKIILEHH